MGEHGERSKSFHEVDGDSHRSQVPGSGRLSQGAGNDQGTACRGKGEGNPQTAASDHDERDVAGRQRMTLKERVIRYKSRRTDYRNGDAEKMVLRRLILNCPGYVLFGQPAPHDMMRRRTDRKKVSPYTLDQGRS